MIRTLQAATRRMRAAIPVRRRAPRVDPMYGAALAVARRQAAIRRSLADVRAAGGAR
jgi:hypothetical protein